MKKVVLWILKFLYRVTGLKALIGWADNQVFIYRRRLNIVPVTYKLFLVALGAVLSLSWFYAYNEYQIVKEPLVFENPAVIHTAKAEEVAPVVAEPEWKTARFTAYTASVDETDSSPLVMASGKMVYVGAIACPRGMKFGTKIEVRGHGTFTCEDTMAEKNDGHFDIFKVTKQEAFSFGKKFLEWREI